VTEKGYIGSMAEREKKSRTQRKQETQALQKLGERLVELTPEQLQHIPLEEELAEAVLLARKLKKHEAKRRQMQYIGSLMRQMNPEPIQIALAQIDQSHQSDIRVFRLIEKWRDALLTGDEALIRTLTKAFPDIDLQKILKLMESSRSEKAAGRQPKSSRALFRYLKPFAHRWIHDD